MAPAPPVKNILLAEDDGDDRLFFAEFLGDRPDIRLLPAVTNGAEVIEYLTALPPDGDRPDVIVLDQNMPKLTGKETLALLKSQPLVSQYDGIPVVIYSTHTGPELVRDCLALGAALVVPKPDSPEGYNEMMDEILGKVG